MEGVKVAYILGSMIVMAIGIVMLLRRAFATSVWWGLGCILVPIVLPIFVFSKWTETKKGFLILFIGSALYGGIYLYDRQQTNEALSKIQVTKITITTDVDDTHQPVSDLNQISFDDKRVFMHVKMQVPSKKTYKFTGELYDPVGRKLLDSTVPMYTTHPVWNSWFYHNFDKTTDVPGQWRFVFLVNGRQFGEHSFQVTATKPKGEESNL